MRSVVGVEYPKQHNSNLKQKTMFYDSLCLKRDIDLYRKTSVEALSLV